MSSSPAVEHQCMLVYHTAKLCFHCTYRMGDETINVFHVA